MKHVFLVIAVKIQKLSYFFIFFSLSILLLFIFLAAKKRVQIFEAELFYFINTVVLISRQICKKFHCNLRMIISLIFLKYIL